MGVTCLKKIEDIYTAEERRTERRSLVEGMKRLHSAGRGYLSRKQLCPFMKMKQKGYDVVPIEEFRQAFRLIQTSNKYIELSEFTDFQVDLDQAGPCAIRLSDGILYLGDIDARGDIIGTAIQVLPEQFAYIGDSSHGQLLKSNGDCYVGSFANKKANGKGIYLKQDGSMYKGNFHDDLPHGKGKEICVDRSKYKGFYSNGMKHGFGEIIWDDGRSYKGNFAFNQFEGKGIFIWPDGKKYNGDWRNGRFHGRGEFLWPDQRRFEGSYVDDQKEGHGKMTWPDGRQYIGGFKAGMQHGRGVISYYKKGRLITKEGEWNNGNRVIWIKSI